MVDLNTINGNSGVINTGSTTKGSTQSSDAQKAADGIERLFKFDLNHDYFIDPQEAEGNMSEEQRELANEALAKRRAAYNNDVAEIASMKAASTQPTDEQICQQFDHFDGNNNNRITAKEYTDALAQDWLNNKEIQKRYGNITDYLNDKYEEFQRFAGDDNVMNIDEFTNMVFTRFAEQNRPPMRIELDPKFPTYNPEKAGQYITNDDGTKYHYTEMGVKMIDDNNRKIIFKDATGKVTVEEYDERGNCISFTRYNSDGSFYSGNRNLIDSDGNFILTYHYKDDDQ